MCTLICRFQPGEPWPVAILANRDEVYDRPMEGWAWRQPLSENDLPRYFAPQDCESGGTWIGLNEWGLVAALTNIYPGRKDRPLKSRGAVVVAVLALTQAAEAHELLEITLYRQAYNNFNLVVADKAKGTIFSWSGRELRLHTMSPGIYQVTNTPFVGDRLPPGDYSNEVWIEQETRRLQAHPEVCKHGDGFGTRCSHKLLLSGEEPPASLVWHCDGHPCRNRYRQVLPAYADRIAV